MTSVMANLWTKKGAKKYKPADFMPRFRQRQQSWQEQLRMVEQLNAKFGGRDLRH